MTYKPCDFGGTSKSEKVSTHPGDIQAWAALDIANKRVFSHIEIYNLAGTVRSYVQIELTADQMIQFAISLVRIAEYRRELDEQLQ